MTQVSPVAGTIRSVDGDYAYVEADIYQRLATCDEPLFTTDADPKQLWELYLNSLSVEIRQHYNCHSCRDFLQRCGGLVRVTTDGDVIPLLWGPYADYSAFAGVAEAMNAYLMRRKVTGVFFSSYSEIGSPSINGWTHLRGRVPVKSRNRDPNKARGEKRTDYETLHRALAEYKVKELDVVMRVLEAVALNCTEKVFGQAQWFLDVIKNLSRVSFSGKSRRDAVVWRAVADAPPGWCHVRTTMLGSLLDDVKAGKSFDQIKAAWTRKMHPLQYQRPQATPKAGAIDHAERVFADLDLAASLRRRFARLEDIAVALWTPKPKPQDTAAEGIFYELRRQGNLPREMELPARSMTLNKFLEEVMPSAHKMEMYLHNTDSFFGLTTAVDPAAKPILQWDGEPRNPVTHYFYSGGSTPHRWGCRAGTWVEVTCVFNHPAHWHHADRFSHHGEYTMFAMAGFVDQTAAELALFPETLRSELHEVRAVIEAYSKSHNLEDREQGTANGFAIKRGTMKNPSWPVDPIQLRVDGRDVYNIIGWE